MVIIGEVHLNDFYFQGACVGSDSLLQNEILGSEMEEK